MRRIDYHMHTFFSTDSEGNPEEYIKKAIELGLDEICFTDHYDVDYPFTPFIVTSLTVNSPMSYMIGALT